MEFGLILLVLPEFVDSPRPPTVLPKDMKGGNLRGERKKETGAMVGMYEDLRDKIVLVTGGATGLGYAIAEAFAANRSNVFIVGRDGERLERAKNSLGGGVRAVLFDLNEIDLIPGLVKEVTAKAGEIDILVNNAGINVKRDALSVTNREFQETILTNQTAVFALSREVGKSMVARGTGSIIMMSSMASHYGIPKVVGYAASKAAVEGMTRTLAVEWSPYGVRVNCIAPGFIATEMSSRAFENDPARKERVLARTPLGKLGEPLDVANAALFLASGQSKYVTGIILPVDGGNSIGF
jgi:NAD(P)-dependent dehydrogenase (short-subunit alcohol dehydrogenase family)